MVDRARAEFLPGSAFPCEQDRHVAVRHHLHQGIDSLHGHALADHVIETCSRFKTVTELLVLKGQGMTLKGLLHDHRKPLTIDRFCQIVVGAQTHRFHSRIDRAKGGHDHDLRVRPFGF